MLPRRMPAPVPYGEPSSLPSLDALLARVQAQSGLAAPQEASSAFPGVLPPTDSGEGLTDPLGALLAPYRAPVPGMGVGGGLGALSPLGGGFDPLGGGGGAAGYGGATGFTAPGGGPAVAPGGSSAAIPYSGPPDPTVAQWEAAYPTTGRIPIDELRRVPMNTTGLVNRYEDAKPWEDRPQVPQGAERDVLMPEAAQSWRAMMRDAAQEGVPLVFGQSYRSYPEQVAAAQSRGIYGQGGWAAVPGTSQHGLGLAVDLDLGASPGQRDWLVEHGPDYGWYFPMGDEPWHVQYEGGFEGWSPSFEASWSPSAGASSTSRPASGSSVSASPQPRRRSTVSRETTARRRRALSY